MLDMKQNNSAQNVTPLTASEVNIKQMLQICQ